PRSNGGGTRDPAARVRLEPADVADLMGCMTSFSPEKLRELYGTPERYQLLFGAALARLVSDRWIAPADAERALLREGVKF
ncbi:MAG: alpha/beta hydrolase domain-containing protein, partial [Polyangiales bacterium]